MRYLIFSLVVVGLLTVGGCESKELLQSQEKNAALQAQVDECEDGLGKTIGMLRSFSETDQENTKLKQELSEAKKKMEEEISQLKQATIEVRRKDRMKVDRAMLISQGKIKDLTVKLSKSEELVQELKARLMEMAKQLEDQPAPAPVEKVES